MLVRRICFGSFIALFFACIGVPTNAHTQRRQGSRVAPPSEATKSETENLFIEAEKFYILENYENALHYLKKAAKLDASNGDIYYKIAEILHKGGKENQTQAATYIEKALTWQKKNKYFYLLAADIYAASQNFSRAAEVLATMLKEINGTENYLYRLGLMYTYAGKFNKALKAYTQAENMLGASKESLLPKYELYLKLGKEREAMNVLNTLVSTFPDEEPYSLERAQYFAQKQQWAEAIDVLNRFIKKHPKSQNSHLLLVEIYQKNNQKIKARALLGKLFSDPNIDINHKIATIGLYVDTLKEKKQQADTALVGFALHLLHTLREVYPNDPNVHVVGGDLYLTLNRLTIAVAEYRKAIQKGTTQFGVWQNVLSLESELNQFDSLVVHSREAIDLFPDQPIFYYLNGYAHWRKNNYKKATSILEEAKKHAMLDLKGTINEMLGDIYNTLKEYEKADKAYDEALLLDPNNDVVLNNYSYYLAIRKDSLEKAEKMAARVVKNQPANNAYLDTYAWVLFMRGKYKKAKSIMENIMQTNPSDPVFFDHYGDILFKTGNVEQAVEQWKKARAKGLNDEPINKKIINKKIP